MPPVMAMAVEQDVRCGRSAIGRGRRCSQDEGKNDRGDNSSRDDLAEKFHYEKSSIGT